MKVTKTTSHSLSQLKDSVDGFHSGISESGFHEGEDAVPVSFEGSGELAKRFQSGSISPAAPPFETFFLAHREHVLKAVPQTKSASQLGAIGNKLLAGFELLFRAGPFVAPNGPDAT